MDSLTGSINGSAASHHDTHEDSQNGTWTPPRSRRGNPMDMVNAGGIGSGPRSPRPSIPIHEINQALDLYAAQYLPGHPKSLSGIATRSFLLGISLALSTTITILLLERSSSLWRLPLFMALLSAFHFLEFWTTARYNPPTASISSFLFSQNGSAYTIANTAAVVEYILTSYFFPHKHLLPSFLNTILLTLSLVTISLGQIIRTWAMISAGTNFNHIVQHTKSPQHKLITSGIYAWFRHPSYFGYFWWGVGTQIMMGNAVCTLGYAVVLWKFFSARIRGEERLLVGFFGEEYVRYRERSWVGIPFI
jgi:protein-S-isoprenylcysteine O-methyltransferase